MEEKILFTDFTATMIPGNYVTQQEEFDITPETELDYFGVCFFEEREKSRELTKKFSLYVGYLKYVHFNSGIFESSCQEGLFYVL